MFKKSTFWGGGVKALPPPLATCLHSRCTAHSTVVPRTLTVRRCCCSLLVSHSLSGNRGEPLLYTHVATTTSRLLATTLNSCGLLVKVQQLVVAVSYYATTNRLLEHFPLQLVLSAMFWHSVSIILSHIYCCDTVLSLVLKFCIWMFLKAYFKPIILVRVDTDNRFTQVRVFQTVRRTI